MSAAAFDTSVPVMPIATPMSACFNAGASFTPSPVIATTCPRDCNARTSLSFCSGATRANTAVLSATSGSSSSDTVANSLPSIATNRPSSSRPFSPI